VKLSEACKKELEAAEGRIQVLVERGRGAMDVAELDVEEEEEE
jgi:exodeoxyribonuclease VII small subunit